MEEIKRVKLVMLGYTNTGKTSIAHRYVYGSFDSVQPSSYTSTCLSKTVNKTTFPLQLQIWDTVGQEKFRSLNKLYYQDACVAILVYDVTSPKSYEEIKYWVNQLSENISMEQTILILAANKCDLIEDEKVSMKEAKDYANQIHAMYFRVSAKNNIGINEMFDHICKIVTPVSERVSTKISNQPAPKAKGSCC